MFVLRFCSLLWTQSTITNAIYSTALSLLLLTIRFMIFFLGDFIFFAHNIVRKIPGDENISVLLFTSFCPNCSL